MKKCFSVLALALVMGLGFASAEVDTWAKPGTIEAQAGVGLYWHGFGQIQVGGAYDFAQVPIAPTFPLDFGVAARAAVTTSELGAGVYGTASYSWKALKSGQKWMDGLETYLGLGVSFLPNFGLDGLGGIAYHFDKSWAIYGEAGQFGGVLGGVYRF